jgi:predicted restriction endonuclease
LVAFLEDPANREKARHLLIAKYFRPSEQIALYEMIGLPVPSRRGIVGASRARPRAERRSALQTPEEARLTGREARFRIRVVSAYNFTFALTGYRLTTVTAGSIVDAAHIHEFRDGRNNDPRNRMPTGHSIKGDGRYRMITESSLLLGSLQKQDRMRIIYWQAITEDGFISRKIKLFGQIRFTLLEVRFKAA